MLYLNFRSSSDNHYDVMDMSTGKVTPSTAGVVCAGTNDKYVLYTRLDKYDLRMDMARKLRPHQFRYEIATGISSELFTKWERDFQTTQCWMMPDGRYFLLGSIREEDGRLLARAFSANQDGSDVKLLWETDGYPYSFEKSPTGTRYSYHFAGYDPEFCPGGGYAVNIMYPDGSRKYVYDEPRKHCFGPIWSPDEEWFAFIRSTPIHIDAEDSIFTDICICRVDGSDFRTLTKEKHHYGGTNAGLPDHRTSGTNRPIWTPEGHVIYTRSLPGSHPDVHYDGTQRDHEEWIYDPSMERGGCGLVEHDPITDEITELTPAVEGCWDFRPCLSPDGKKLVFTRAYSGEAPALYMMDRETGEITFLTRGENDLGADYPWFTEGEFIRIDS